jgi:hypothetical protein
MAVYNNYKNKKSTVRYSSFTNYTPIVDVFPQNEEIIKEYNNCRNHEE